MPHAPARRACERTPVCARRVASTLALSTFALALVALPSLARAQQAHPTPITSGGGFDLRLFRPAVDSKGQFTVNGTDILGAWDVAFGLVMDYGRGLARMGLDTHNGMATRSLVDNQFNGTFIADVGLLNWLVVGATLPFHLYDGPGANPSLGLDPAQYAAPNAGFSVQGIGDLSLHVKLRLLRSEITHFGLAVILQAGFPLNNDAGGSIASRNFAGEPGISLWPSVAFEWRPVRAFRVDINAGYRQVFGVGSTLTSADRATTVTYGSPLTAGLGFSVRVVPAVELVAEAYTAMYTNQLGNTAAMPMEAVGGLKVFVQRNSYLMLGAGTRIPIGNAPAAADFRAFLGIVFEPSIGDRDGDGIRDDVDHCPDQPEDFDLFEDSDGCPDPDNDRDGILDVSDACPNVPEDRDGDHDEDGCPEGDEGDRDGDRIIDRVDQCPDQPEDHDGFQDADGCPDPDNDRDGILDTDDLCPNDAEDRDNFQDEDGCPDPDNDHDRIPDSRDRCPNDPETYNGEADDDGCPDTGIVMVEEHDIRTLRAIHFETNSARIRDESVPVIEAVARTLQAHVEIQLVEVQGHADERGDDAANVQLTGERAASVVDALVARGVARERLHSAGYGERCRAGYPETPGQDPANAVCQHGGPHWCHTERAWRNDRRVVFLLLRTADGAQHLRVACDAGEALIPAEDRQYHQAR